MKKEELVAKIEEQRKLTNIALEEDRVDANDHEVIICVLDWMENLARQLDNPPELTEEELAAVKDLLGPINHGFTAAGKSALRKLCEQNRIEIKEIISREDALKIASHILETAEKERIEHAEKEAKAGIQYDK